MFVEKQESKKNKVKDLLQNLMLFFINKNAIYGAPEEGRIVFARMKTPDNEIPWDDEEGFMAYDLIQAVKNKEKQNTFSAKDLPHINIIDRDNAENILINYV